MDPLNIPLVKNTKTINGIAFISHYFQRMHYAFELASLYIDRVAGF